MLSVTPHVRVFPRRLRGVPVEAVVWLAGLALMATLDPTTGADASWCLSHVVGLGNCPGCGLGHSVAHLARGHVAASVAAHPLGIPVVGILLARSGRLLYDAASAEGRAPHSAPRR